MGAYFVLCPKCRLRSFTMRTQNSLSSWPNNCCITSLAKGDHIPDLHSAMPGLHLAGRLQWDRKLNVTFDVFHHQRLNKRPISAQKKKILFKYRDKLH